MFLRFARALIVMTVVSGSVCCAGMPVFAQEDEAETQADGELAEIVPTGPKGRYTQAEAQALALRQIPGEVTASNVKRVNRSDLHYIFTIQAPDGSVYEAYVSANSGKFYKIDVVSLSANPVYPFDIVAKDFAEILAKGEMDERTHGIGTPKILESALVVRDRRLVYEIKLRKIPGEALVTIDAVTAKVVDYKWL